jgi:hypothetical protein
MKNKPNGLCESCRVPLTECSIKLNCFFNTKGDEKCPGILACADYIGSETYCPNTQCTLRNPACADDRRKCLVCELCENTF